MTPRHVDQVAPANLLHPGKEVSKAHLTIFVVLTIKGRMALRMNFNRHPNQIRNLRNAADILRVPVRLVVIPLRHNVVPIPVLPNCSLGFFRAVANELALAWSAGCHKTSRSGSGPEFPRSAAVGLHPRLYPLYKQRKADILILRECVK